jgi:hypothetical protein
MSLATQDNLHRRVQGDAMIALSAPEPLLMPSPRRQQDHLNAERSSHVSGRR